MKPDIEGEEDELPVAAPVAIKQNNTTSHQMQIIMQAEPRIALR